jgi:hypothetical protein
MPPFRDAQSSKDLFVNGLKLHQAVNEGTHGRIRHWILLGMFAIANVANRSQFSAYRKKTDKHLAVVVLTRR